MTDTEKWKRPWFQELPPKYKLLWLYLTDNCDHAGIWIVNFGLASYMCGDEYKIDECKEYIGKQIFSIENDKYWFLIDFIPFQQGCSIEGLNPKSNIENSIIKRLKQLNIIELLNNNKNFIEPKGLVNPSLRVKDKDKDKDMVIGISTAIDNNKSKEDMLLFSSKCEKEENDNDDLTELQIYIRDNCPTFKQAGLELKKDVANDLERQYDLEKSLKVIFAELDRSKSFFSYANKPRKTEPNVKQFIVNCLNNNPKKYNLPPIKPKTDDPEVIEFLKCYNAYLGTRKAWDTEFYRFKKHRDWQDELPKIYPAIIRECNYKQELKQKSNITPLYKAFSTWLDERDWEREFGKIIEGNDGTYKRNYKQNKPVGDMSKQKLAESIVQNAENILRDGDPNRDIKW